MGELRRLPAARVRLGMRVANGFVVAEVMRPDKSTVKRGYGRVLIGFHDPSGCGPDVDCSLCPPDQEQSYYPHDLVPLDGTETSPADTTMDDWPGRWWPVDAEVLP